jgi:hypothetical protein
MLGLAAASLLAGSCGGPSSPDPVAPATPLPTPSAGGDGGPSPSSCPIGEGDPAAECGKGTPRLLAEVEAAIDALVRDEPALFDTKQGADSGLYKVLDEERYLDGVIANLRKAGLCSERALDGEQVMAKRANDFSEEWDVLSAGGFIRRGAGSYQRTCEPAVFPVAPADLVAYVRTAFFSFECGGVPGPPPTEGRLPLGCDGYATATPKQRNGRDVPSWIHGAEIRWELRDGEDVVEVLDDWRFLNPFNKVLRPTGRPGRFLLCASVLGKEGCLDGHTIP